MNDSPPARSDEPYWSLAGLRHGVRITLPLLPGTIVFAMALGTIAAQKGLSLFETALMSFLTYSGAAQLVALEIWPAHMSVAAISAIALVTATISLRFVLMSAAFRPWFGSLPASQAYPALFFTTDSNWLIAMRYRAEGGRDVAVFVGSGLIMWSIWIAGTALGHMAGALLTDPKRFGFDLVLPIFFAALLVPLWRGSRRALAWAIAGGVALAVAWALPGWWFIVAGALAGSVAGGLLDERT